MSVTVRKVRYRDVDRCVSRDAGASVTALRSRSVDAALPWLCYGVSTGDMTQAQPL